MAEHCRLAQEALCMIGSRCLQSIERGRFFLTAHLEVVVVSLVQDRFHVFKSGSYDCRAFLGTWADSTMCTCCVGVWGRDL